MLDLTLCYKIINGFSDTFFDSFFASTPPSQSLWLSFSDGTQDMVTEQQ